MKTYHQVYFISAVLIANGLVLPTVTCASTAKPSRVEASLNGGIGYDSNVYLANQGPLGRVDSAVSTVGAKVAAKFEDGAWLSYAATGSTYWNARDEDNIKHVLGAGLKQTYDPFSFSGTTEFAQVQGADTGSNYGAINKSTFATVAPRERRDQLQNKSDVAARYDTHLGFVRGVGKLQWYDMQTKAVSPGENYRDRYDVNGGFDLGRAPTTDGPEYYLGYRRGYAFQDNDGTSSIKNASNSYDRYLVGADGKVTKTFKLAAQAGWSMHHYTGNYDGADHNLGNLYHDATATWTATARDELQFKTAQGRTVSSTSKASILASQYQVTWKHDFNPQWFTTFTTRVCKNNYDGSTDRSDVLYTAIAALTWKSSAHLAWTLSASQDMARNIMTQQTAAFGDQAAYDRTFLSLGVNWKL